MKIRKFRRIWGKPWDYCYLLEIEQRKLKEMAEYFKKSQLTVGWEIQVRDCELCVKLIDIILEKTKAYRSWLHNNYGQVKQSIKDMRPIPFSIYVNTRNAKRFIHHFHLTNNDLMNQHHKMELYRRKAMYLYHKIRLYKIETWWD